MREQEDANGELPGSAEARRVYDQVMSLSVEERYAKYPHLLRLEDVEDGV